MAEIDYYCFPISPFSYLAGRRLEDVAGKHSASITYKPVELMRIFAETGTPPVKDRHPSRQTYRLREIERVAEAEGMPVNLQPHYFPTNPVPVSVAIIAAQEAGGGDVGELLRFFLRATWAEDRDVADDSVVREGLSSCGFDPDLADSGMLSGLETLQRNTEEALKRHVFGSPTYVIGEEVFWGQDRLPHLDAYLAKLA